MARVFISADMEGATGVATPKDVVRGEDGYERGTELLHGDVNAAVAGAVAGGADEVLVNDSHATMRNLDRERLDDRADLIRGSTKPRSMTQGLDPDHDVALFVGYHAKAGTPNAVLNHTFIGHELVELRVDGTPAGEMGWNARMAGALGVPVGLVTGDDRTTAEAGEEVPDAETVAVKTGVDRFTARCRPPGRTTAEIREAAERAVGRALEGDLDPADPGDGEVTLEVDWSATNHAARAAALPSVERRGGRTTAVAGDGYEAAYAASVAMFRAGAAGRNDFFG
jgi:D-amino peptidase